MLCSATTAMPMTISAMPSHSLRRSRVRSSNIEMASENTIMLAGTMEANCSTGAWRRPCATTSI